MDEKYGSIVYTFAWEDADKHLPTLRPRHSPGREDPAGLKVFRFNEESGSLTGGGSSYRLKLDSWYQDIELVNYEAKLLNAAQKCVDIILQSELPESDKNCRYCKEAEEFNTIRCTNYSQ